MTTAAPNRCREQRRKAGSKRFSNEPVRPSRDDFKAAATHRGPEERRRSSQQPAMTPVAPISPAIRSTTSLVHFVGLFRRSRMLCDRARMDNLATHAGPDAVSARPLCASQRRRRRSDRNSVMHRSKAQESARPGEHCSARDPDFPALPILCLGVLRAGIDNAPARVVNTSPILSIIKVLLITVDLPR